MANGRRAVKPTVLDRAAGLWPGRPAVFREGLEPLSYAGLQAMVRRETQHLVEGGVAPGDLVALDGFQGLEAVTALHAVWAAGAVALPLNPSLSDLERGRALRALAPRWILRGTGAGLLEMGPWRDQPLPEGTVAVILTSGSSGDPRGVCLTARNLEAVNEASGARLGLGPDDRWLLSLSPAHVGGLAIVHRAALLGSALVVGSGFDPEAFWRHGREGTVTHASLVPTMLLRLVEWLEEQGRTSGGGGHADRGAAGLRCLLVGGAGTPPRLLERAMALGLPVATTYGLTQASSQVATASLEEVREDPATVGLPLEGVEVAIRDADTQGVGEICVRGPTVAPDYLGTGEPLTDAEGWLRTGDLGRTDGKGRLRVAGRIGRRFVSGGVNVEPEGVEDFLRGLDGVVDAVVVGMPDETWGERGEALVVMAPDAPPDAGRLDEACRSSLQPAARPRRFAFAEALPLIANGKVDLREVRRVLASED
jgi:O-succinylbenzoic acid--CoA ligase